MSSFYHRCNRWQEKCTSVCAQRKRQSKCANGKVSWVGIGHDKDRATAMPKNLIACAQDKSKFVSCFWQGRVVASLAAPPDGGMVPIAVSAGNATNWCGDFKDSRALRETLGAPSDGFASCAVVGSSGILNLERLGERIDRSELVIRFNLQGVHGYEPIVGRRTSLRSINSEAIGFILAEHWRDIHAGGGTLRRFRNASWCPTYPVYLNSGKPLHLSAFRAVCSGVTTIIDDSVFDEHKAVLKSLGPQDANLMSGQLGVALATMLCPKGVDVYGVTHNGSQTITQNREVRYHYFDANAQLNAQLDSLDDSARLLSLFAEVTLRGFISAQLASCLSPSKRLSR